MNVLREFFHRKSRHRVEVAVFHGLVSLSLELLRPLFKVREEALLILVRNLGKVEVFHKEFELFIGSHFFKTQMQFEFGNRLVSREDCSIFFEFLEHLSRALVLEGRHPVVEVQKLLLYFVFLLKPLIEGRLVASSEALHLFQTV